MVNSVVYQSTDGAFADGHIVPVSAQAALVVLLGVGTVTDFTITGVFLVRVLDSLATVTLGTAIPLILIPTPTMAIPTMTDLKGRKLL
jgi:hypothetical protein